MFNNILVVCVGNICRSPIGEGLLQAKLPDANISSAGIGAMIGYPAAPHSIHLMRQQGFDISTHIARQIDRQMVSDADLILTMEERHNQYIRAKFIGTAGKVHLIGKWIDNHEIADPIGKDERAYSIAMANIARGIDLWVEQISEG
jgi:protein-tyrosine phosphatase